MTVVPEALESVSRLKRDVRVAADHLSEREARYLVDAYYAMQEHRIEAQNQVRSLVQSDEPNDVLGWLMDQHYTLEKEIAKALDTYTSTRVPGVWAKSIVGIGPIIAAGMLANIDIANTPSVGKIWRFAGLDPTREWISTERAKVMIRDAKEAHGGDEVTFDHVLQIAGLLNVKPERLWDSAIPKERDGTIKGKGTITFESLQRAISRRPWNAGFKVVCWKAGESFVKVSGNERDVYGKVYKERKEMEAAKNERREYADQAAHSLATKQISKTTDAYKWYADGMLPPARIHARAKRYAVKLFIAHLHHVMYVDHFGTKPPMPYIIQHGGHTHFIAPPNWIERSEKSGDKVYGEVAVA